MRFIIELAIWLVSAFASIYAEELWNAKSARIMGGIPISISDAKFVVNIRSYGNYKCVGSLITPRHVVTAAHCVFGSWRRSLKVTAGVTFLKETGVQRSIRRIFIPSAYDRPPLNMDLAVLELSSAMYGDNITTIELCNSTGQNYYHVYGWGKTRYAYPSKRLRMVKVPSISRSKCLKSFKNFNVQITPAMFCAGDLNYRDACIGDSGGPAVYQNQLCGVVSWGPECASKIYPGVYTNITHMRNFIENVIRK
uniref:Peptidase S1 domain-containing protein n=1 Tax=Stomoxys calcitrans TaxID=35570 RepID=A0A1I8PSI2_STOCA